MNPFIRSPKEYRRDLNIVENYTLNMAQYIATMTGHEFESVVEWIKQNINPVEPKLKLLVRRNGGDRKKEIHGFDKYIREISHANRLLGPNLVVYENPKKKKSFISDFIEKGLERRAVVKKKGQLAEMAGDMETYTFCDNQQGRIKILNNSISGAHASPHNPIYNKTAHTTLTSPCRCITTISDALAEKMLAGNRHYQTPEIAMADMASIIRIADLDAIRMAMITYDIKPPTAAYVIEHVLTSCRLYWRSGSKERQLKQFINAMSDIELAAVAYVSDLKAIRDNNDFFMRKFISSLMEKPTEPVDNPETYHSKANGDMLAMIGLIMSEELNGRTVYKMKDENPEDYKLYGAAVKQVFDWLAHYKDFIVAFLRTDCMPPSIHSLPSSLRRVVVVSDTDSTVFTTEKWVTWYIGKNEFTRKAMSVAGAMAYIDSQVLAHHLALLSKHMGVEESKLFRLSMKPEFYQPVFGVTNMSKHYFSYILACEGNVYHKPKFDVKGVNLKNSRLPMSIRGAMNQYIMWIMDAMMRGHKPTLAEALKAPAMLAHDICRSLGNGDVKYLSSMQIKSKASYKGDNPPAWVNHMLWKEVFSPLYGESDEPPYTVIKAPVTVDTRARLEAWAKTLDAATAERLGRFMCQHAKYTSKSGVQTINKGDLVIKTQSSKPGVLGVSGRIYEYQGYEAKLDLGTVKYKEEEDAWKDVGSTRDSFTSFWIPTSRLQNGLLPKELLPILDAAKIEDELLSGFMIALETTGYYIRNGNRTRLLSKEIDLSIYEGDGNGEIISG